MIKGVRVVEVCPLFPGPFAAQILRHYGANVVKVIPKPKPHAALKPHQGSNPIQKRSTEAKMDNPMAAFSNPDGSSNKVGPMSVFDDGKEILPLDLALPEDAQRLQEHLAQADVALLGHRPGSTDKFGLNPKSLRNKYPDLIICCLSGYGSHGPLAKRAGHDLNYLARAGVLGMQPGLGNSSGEGSVASADLPVRSPLPVQVADVAGGTYPTVMHILAALLRQRTPSASRSPAPDQLPGGGCIIDISMTDNAHNLLVLSEAVHEAFGGIMPVDNGQFFLCGSAPCYNLYPTKDGRYMAVGALEPNYWKIVVDTLGLPSDLKSAYAQFGLKNKEQVEAQIKSVFLSKTFKEWIAVFDAVDAMVDPVLTPDEAKESPHLAHRIRSKRSVLEGFGLKPEPKHKDLVDSVPPMPAMDFVSQGVMSAHL
jgi:alpha-methylacyl-CoA racemase